MTTQNNATLDSILDCVLDDLADLPEFKNFPVGTHKVLATMESKTISAKPAVEFKMVYVEPLELANPQDAAPAAGDTCNIAFFLDNEIGQGKFKAVAAQFSGIANSDNLREIVAATKGVECIVVTSLRKDKNDATKSYMNLVEVAVI